MALVYQATLTPPKLELVSAWLASRPWGKGKSDLRSVGAYRFDDPAGEVGIEAFLVQASDGSVLHAPMTYRGAPLAGAQDHLVGTSEHSVLGPRWLYDGCADPVWAATLANAVLAGAAQAEVFIDVDGKRERRVPTATVSGSGTAAPLNRPIDAVTCRDEGLTTIIQADGLELVVARVIGADISGAETLTGRWTTGGPALLAGVRPT
jgi:maltokinase-like protein